MWLSCSDSCPTHNPLQQFLIQHTWHICLDCSSEQLQCESRSGGKGESGKENRCCDETDMGCAPVACQHRGTVVAALLVTGFLAFPQEVGSELPPVMLGPSP